jgi:hypothetical protein
MLDQLINNIMRESTSRYPWDPENDADMSFTAGHDVALPSI